MDDFDKNIIDILESDGRASNAEIARKIGVSEGTIRRRLKKLIDNKTIRFWLFLILDKWVMNLRL